MPYQFTADWFSPNIPVWRDIFGTLMPTRVLEIGSYEGRSASFMIEECRSLEYIACVDTWAGSREHDATQMASVEERFDLNTAEALQRTGRSITVRKIKQYSYFALSSFIVTGERFDLIYIDGSHEAPDVLSDAVQSFHVLRRGGVLIFDDYIWRDDASDGHDILSLPKLAIDGFVNVFHRKMVAYKRYVPLFQIYLTKL